METKERPILFSGPLVRAILEGRKTVTRRLCKSQPTPWVGHYLEGGGAQSDWKPERCDDGSWCLGSAFDTDDVGFGKCPYGQPGDRLWVRETWGAGVVGDCVRIEYRADGHLREFPGRTIALKKPAQAARGDEDGVWRPSIFLPRWASRIALDVVSVRVERLQDIDEADAVREGMTGSETQTPLEQFVSKWNEIYGAGEWARNGWVWRIAFSRRATHG